MVLKRLFAALLLLAMVCPAMLFAGEKKDHGAYKSGRAVSEDTIFRFDENTPDFSGFSFNIDKSEQLEPKSNDFELIHFAPMSNKIGERGGLLTVRNTSSGRRFLKSEYVVATFANADQANPSDLNEIVDPGETNTRTINFGVHEYPIVMIQIQP
jgi:hypothetical protein